MPSMVRPYYPVQLLPPTSAPSVPIMHPLFPLLLWAEHIPLGLCSSLECPSLITNIIFIITITFVELCVGSKIYMH